MPSDKPRFDGVIESARGNGFFIVVADFEPEKKQVLCQLSGKIRRNTIKVVPGDRVVIEVDPGDLDRGRIVYRER